MPGMLGDGEKLYLIDAIGIGGDAAFRAETGFHKQDVVMFALLGVLTMLYVLSADDDLDWEAILGEHEDREAERKGAERKGAERKGAERASAEARRAIISSSSGAYSSRARSSSSSWKSSSGCTHSRGCTCYYCNGQYSADSSGD